MTTTTKNPRAGRRGGSGNTDALEKATAGVNVPARAMRCKRRASPGTGATGCPIPRPTTAPAWRSLARATATAWAQGLCPFHHDCSASFSVGLDGGRGLWRCG
jgi:hypothetical protein